MDIVAAAFETGALALYMVLRQRNLNLAVLASQVLIVAAGMCHPLAAVGALDLLVFTIYFDRQRLRWRHLGLAIIPYLCGAVGWGLYIGKAPSTFMAQFGGNASDRWLFFTAPLTSLKKEIAVRYFDNFGWAPDTSGVSHIKILILIAYLVGMIGALSSRTIRNHKGWRVLLVCAALNFFGVAVLDGFKESGYLIHTVPFFVAVLAIWIHHAWMLRTLPRWLAAGGVAGLVLVQLAVIGARVVENPYKKDFLPAAAYLQRNSPAGQMIMASAEFAFQLGFDSNLVDDFRMGYRSGRRAACIMIDKPHYAEWSGHLREQDPANYAYIQRLLTDDFHVVYDHGYYKLYCRNDVAAVKQ
jgi:hypothetical protein